MSTAPVRSNGDGKPGAATIDMKLEVVVIPVSDTERATQFYRKLGWRQDVTPPGSGIFQFTPPGSGCSVQVGAGRTTAAPGTKSSFVSTTVPAIEPVCSWVCALELLPAGAVVEPD